MNKALKPEPKRRPFLEPTGYDPDSIKAWILKMCEGLDVTPSALAKKAGVAASTLTRFLSGNSINTNISTSSIAKISFAALAIFEEKFQAGTLPPIPEPDYSDVEPGPEFQRLRVSTLPVLGAVEAGVYRDAVEWPEEDRYLIQAPVAGAYGLGNAYALEVRGESMNKLYPNGSIVICVSFYSLDRFPISGERVVAYRKKDTLGVEATVKEFRIDPQGDAWLLPLSDHPDHQRAIYLGKIGSEREDEEVHIEALVVGSYRREPEFA